MTNYKVHEINQVAQLLLDIALCNVCELSILEEINYLYTCIAYVGM